MRQPLDLYGYIQDGKFKITHQHALTYIFDPIVNQILKLIDEQLIKTQGITPNNLYLVGSFSQSRYLYQRIKQEFVHTGRVGRICVPNDYFVASARGAVLYGLDPSIIFHRTARHSYAVRCNKKFRDGIDDPVNMVVRKNGQRRCRNRLDFFVSKNTKMDRSYYFEREYSAIYPHDNRSVLYSYDGQDDTLPDYVDSDGIKEVLRLIIRMPVIPGKKDGDKISYKTRTHIGHDEIKVEVLIGGETQVHTVNISDQPPKPLVEREFIPGYKEIINYLNMRGFRTNRYSTKRYLLKAPRERSWKERR